MTIYAKGIRDKARVGPMTGERREGATALVVGGGIGGLAAALGLRRAGFMVDVLERKEAIREEGAGISLWPNAMRALDVLGVGDAVRGAGRLQEGGAIRSRQGTVLSKLDGQALAARFGGGIVMTERAMLVDLLHEALGGVPIHLDAEAVGISPGPPPSVKLSDGTQRSADLVIGADGIGSTIRTTLFDRNPPRPSGLVAWRAIATVDDALEARLLLGECWHDGTLFGMTPVSGRRVYWWAADRAEIDPAASAADRRTALMELLDGWPDPIDALVTSTAADDIVFTPLLERRPLRRIVKGEVALVGDAAHPMLPHLGQGACQALEDAAVLGACLSPEHCRLSGGLKRYEKLRARRTASVLRQSARMARIAHLRSPLAGVRNLALRSMPASAGLRQLDGVAGWEMPASR
jgi:2-polyprenyl-6-methoxyphenol hydroxylase-like FAD-dependent oxidoreductase